MLAPDSRWHGRPASSHELRILPAELPEGATLRNLLVLLVGIDLKRRWQSADMLAETQLFVGQAASPDASESSVSLPLRPRLADYVTR